MFLEICNGSLRQARIINESQMWDYLYFSHHFFHLLAASVPKLAYPENLSISSIQRHIPFLPRQWGC